MVPPQHGHGQVARSVDGTVWVGERGLAISASNWRQTSAARATSPFQTLKIIADTLGVRIVVLVKGL